MSNEIAPGKRVLVKARPEDRELTPGIVQEVVDRAGFPGLAHHQVLVLVGGETITRPMPEVKLATQDTDPAAWMLHDGKTSRHAPGVQEIGLERGCYICADPEFAQMGLPLCRPCPECQRKQQDCPTCQGTGGLPDHTPCTDCLATGKLGLPGHIPADDGVCDICGHEETPADYPQPEPVLPLRAVVHASAPVPEVELAPGKDAAIPVPLNCTVYGVQIWDSADPAKPVYWIAVGKALRAGDSVHVPGTFDVVAD